MAPALDGWAKDPVVHAVSSAAPASGPFAPAATCALSTRPGAALPATPSCPRFLSRRIRADPGNPRFPKPYRPHFAITDGITMGGRPGISVNGAYRIATEA